MVRRALRIAQHIILSSCARYIQPRSAEQVSQLAGHQEEEKKKTLVHTRNVLLSLSRKHHQKSWYFNLNHFLKRFVPQARPMPPRCGGTIQGCDERLPSPWRPVRRACSVGQLLGRVKLDDAWVRPAKAAGRTEHVSQRRHQLALRYHTYDVQEGWISVSSVSFSISAFTLGSKGRARVGLATSTGVEFYPKK